MGIINALFHKAEPREALRPLYDAVVASARQPDWYAQGTVPDTLDGRFDMIALVLALVLFRMEALGAEAAQAAAQLTEVFIQDMDGNLREIGVGDLVVGKHIGRMMSALGGRLTAYRAARIDPEALKLALVRNIYRGIQPQREALEFVADKVLALNAGISGQPLPALLRGTLG
jgi:cytochrome b pre-mRNA-processing protein 3